jgi:hypothetical protein
MITRRDCEPARIKPLTRSLGSTPHTGLSASRACEPPGRLPDHLFIPIKPEVVAVIDDDLRVRAAIGRLLSALGCGTELYASAKEFLDAAMTTAAISGDRLDLCAVRRCA